MPPECSTRDPRVVDDYLPGPPCLLRAIAMDDDDYNDLTDLGSDDYESKPNKKGSKSQGGIHTGYRIKVPRAATYTTTALRGITSFSVALF